MSVIANFASKAKEPVPLPASHSCLCVHVSGVVCVAHHSSNSTEPVLLPASHNCLCVCVSCTVCVAGHSSHSMEPVPLPASHNCLCVHVSGTVCVARHSSKAEVTEEMAMDEGEATVQINRNDRSISELGVLCLRNEVGRAKPSAMCSHCVVTDCCTHRLKSTEGEKE